MNVQNLIGHRYRNNSRKFDRLADDLYDLTLLEQSALQAPIVKDFKHHWTPRCYTEYRLMARHRFVPKLIGKDFDKIPRMMSVECANCGNPKCRFSIIESAPEAQARKFLKTSMGFYKSCPRNMAYPLTKRRIARLGAKAPA